MARCLPACVICCIVIGIGSPVGAWGPIAHRAIARLAEQRLTPQAKTHVAALLAGQPLANVALWADDVRTTTHPQTYNWHFTNIPIGSSGYVATRDCRPSPRGDCVVAAIERSTLTLRSSKVVSSRKDALQFLVHLVADIHQPLHTGHNADRGGTDRTIAEIGNADNLHGAWDSGIIRASGRNENALVAVANQWLQTQNESQIANSAVVEWANEGFRLARDVAYREVAGDNAITLAERQEAIRIIEKRIAKAGVRLAAVLNRALAAATTEN
jgi:hypothetical protein